MSPGTTARMPATEALRPVVLSLKPRFADAILDGTKTVELRRTRIAAPPGTRLILYASAPVMAVIGIATLATIEADHPERIWRRHRRRLGLTHAEYNAYLEGTHLATALGVTHPIRLPQPYTLATLREKSSFRPPQSYRYLTTLDPDALHAIINN